MAGEIDLKVSADIGDLRRQLENIPGITAEQARLMVAELDRAQDKENRKLRAVLEWVNTQCPSKCAGVCDEALREKPSSPLVDELVLLRTELLEHARLAGMGSEREARLMAQLEEARKELQQERESVVRFLRQPPEKAKACDKPHRHEDGKPCLVLVPVDLDEAADLIEQGKHRIGSSDREP